jgi:hypothetical protein
LQRCHFDLRRRARAPSSRPPPRRVPWAARAWSWPQKGGIVAPPPVQGGGMPAKRRHVYQVVFCTESCPRGLSGGACCSGAGMLSCFQVCLSPDRCSFEPFAGRQGHRRRAPRREVRPGWQGHGRGPAEGRHRRRPASGACAGRRHACQAAACLPSGLLYRIRPAGTFRTGLLQRCRYVLMFSSVPLARPLLV